MSRRQRAKKRVVMPDAKYGDETIAKLIGVLMWDGKRSVAESIVYGALDIASTKIRQEPMDFFHDLINNVKPSVEVCSRRVGGATYQVPIEVRPVRRLSLALRWIVSAARNRNEKTMVDRLANELVDAFNSRGAAVKKREDSHKMAEANKAFSHYRW